MSIWWAIFLVLLGLLCLWKGADWLVDGASEIASSLGVPAIVIGLTIVAFGTSLPELLVSVLSAIRGNSDIAFGNVIGSNIANVLLIFGISALIRNLPIKKSTLKVEIPLAIVAAAMLLFFSPDGVLSTYDGLALLGGFGVFFIYTIASARKENNQKQVKSKNEKAKNEKIKKVKDSKKIWYASGKLIIGLIVLALGGEWTVNGATTIAQILGWSEALIGATIVAVGTSLPELVTCVIGTLKNEMDLVIGNIVGSNIFNTWWILGLSTVIKNINVQGNFGPSLWLNLFTFVLVIIFAFWGKPKYALKRWQGGIFLVMYILYVGSLVAQG